MLRTIEHGQIAAKSYATPEMAEKKAKELADKLYGMVNVRIVPTEEYIGKALVKTIRYTALFYAFSEGQDRINVAFAGFPAYA